jgi:hypothetical protein
MKKFLFTVLLLISPAYAGQIDYYLKFSDEATALAQLQLFINSTSWPTDYCIPNIQIWRNSQDIVDGQGNVTHAYLTGFFVLCSFKQNINALTNLAPVQVVIDRDKAKARLVGGVIKSNLSNPILQDIRISPIFSGTDLPYGSFQ